MKIKSLNFKNYEEIPKKYTCEGENINPSLIFEDIPENAKSLMLIMDDPDVPSSIREDNMWVHWLVFNIFPTTNLINENSKIDGLRGMTTSETLDYVGPCPPDKEHRYFFKLYALDKILDLEEGANKEELENAMKEHVIESTELIGVYCKEENKT